MKSDYLTMMPGLLCIVEDEEQQQGKIFSVLVFKTIQYMLLLYIALSIGIERGFMEQGLLKKIRVAVDTRYPVIFPIEDDGEDGVDQISSSTSLTLCQYATKDFFYSPLIS